MSKAVARSALRGLIALTETETQRAQIATWLDGDDPYLKRALWTCEEIFEQAAAGGVEGRTLMTHALHALLTRSSARQLKALAWARSERLELTRASLLAALLPHQGNPSQDHQRDHASHLSTVEGRSLTLGERRALARRPSAQSIERLASDPDPIVMKHLLQNPRLTEPLLLRIVTQRPQRPLILLMVFEHVKWGKREAVRQALALHPLTPLAIRCLLVQYLHRDDLKAITRESHISPILNAAVRRAEVRLSER